MRPFRRRRDQLDDKLDPALAIRLGDETLAVEQQQRIEAGITDCLSLCYHAMITISRK